jgi:predicted short-subunit dehydrogenase-like oxidoreductase (DUF2520 family)
MSRKRVGSGESGVGSDETPDSQLPTPNSIAIVGAGRVGRTLGRLLAGAGYEITDVVCRRGTSARAAARFVGAGRPAAMRAVERIAARIVLLATPDDALSATAERLAALDQPFDGVVALHTSGARDGSELAALRARGAAVGSLHPLQSFPSPDLGVGLVRGSVFALEGDRAAVAVGKRLATDLGGRPVMLGKGAKALYHAAAVLASGGVTALLDVSLEAMERAGLAREDALRAVLPLVEGTVANVRRVDTARALTGPFARGDRGTIARNRAALAALGGLAPVLYDLLGERGEALRKRTKDDG